MTRVNLNQMLCPLPSDPFAGRFYRLAAMIHQPLLILFLGKLFTAFVLWSRQRGGTSDYLKPLCSSFNWLPSISLRSFSAPEPPNKPDPVWQDQMTDEHELTSFRELLSFQATPKSK